MKTYIDDTNGGKNLKSYILRETISPIINLEASEIFDDSEIFKHKEYHPIINQRVFSLNDDKDNKKD